MISSKELKYVNVRGDQEVPYPGDNYSKEALLELSNSLHLYELYYANKEYDVLFSNGKNFEFEIAKPNLSHIVGLNNNWLIKNNFIKSFYGENVSKSSYEILKDIVGDVEKSLSINKLMDYSLINFYRLKTRAEVFSKFSNFNIFNFGCIFYDQDVALKNGFPTNMKSDRFLFTESDDPNFPYYMMGIAIDDKGSSYVETLFPNNIPEKMFQDQTIAMPTVISTNTPKDFDKKEANASQKLRLVKAFNELEKKYDAKFSYYHDYYSTLAMQARDDERKKVLSK